MLRVACEIIASGLKVLLILAAFGFTSNAFGVDCKDPEADVCAKGQRPDPDHQPYEFCMVQHNDHEYCAQLTGNSGGGGETSTGAGNGSSYAPQEPQEGDWCMLGGDNGRFVKNAWDGGLTCETNLTGSCPSSSALGGRWEGSNSAGYHCTPNEDSDDDGIFDHVDDCPNDPTNSDPYCLDDLTDCNILGAAAIDYIGMRGLTALALKGGSTKLGTLTFGSISAVITVKMAVAAGSAVLTFGTLYCVVAELEN